MFISRPRASDEWQIFEGMWCASEGERLQALTVLGDWGHVASQASGMQGLINDHNQRANSNGAAAHFKLHGRSMLC